MSRRSACVRAFGRSSPVNPPPFSVSSCIGIKPRFSIILRWTILSELPLWINGIILARRLSRLFSGSWCRLARFSPDLVLTLRGCLRARPNYYSRYFYSGSHRFGLYFTSVSPLPLGGGGRRSDLRAVRHLLRIAPGARQPETSDWRRLRKRFGDCGRLYHVAGARQGP